MFRVLQINPNYSITTVGENNFFHWIMMELTINPEDIAKDVHSYFAQCYKLMPLLLFQRLMAAQNSDGYIPLDYLFIENIYIKQLEQISFYAQIIQFVFPVLECSIAYLENGRTCFQNRRLLPLIEAKGVSSQQLIEIIGWIERALNCNQAVTEAHRALTFGSGYYFSKLGGSKVGPLTIITKFMGFMIEKEILLHDSAIREKITSAEKSQEQSRLLRRQNREDFLIAEWQLRYNRYVRPFGAVDSDDEEII